MIYKKRLKYKYTLHSDVSYNTGMTINNPCDMGLLSITKEGELTIRKGYAWDGPSGPTIDTKNFMRASLVHDALYQLMREEVLPQSYRKRADEIMREICKEEGMRKIRSWYTYKGVRWFGSGAAKPDLIKIYNPSFI